MSSAIARRDISAAIERRGTSRSTTREVARDVERVAGRAVVRAAQVEAGAYVAHVGLAYAEALTAQEGQASEMFPERSYRFRAIADGYAAYVVNELRQMGLEG